MFSFHGRCPVSVAAFHRDLRMEGRGVEDSVRPRPCCKGLRELVGMGTVPCLKERPEAALLADHGCDIGAMAVA